MSKERFFILLPVLSIAASFCLLGIINNHESITPHVLNIRSENGHGGGLIPFLDVKINNISIPCVLDTGGHGSLLESKYKSLFKIVKTSESADANGMRLVYETAPLPIESSNSFLGNYSFLIPGDYKKLFNQKEHWTVDVSSIGINVLSQYDVVIDGPNQNINFYPPNSLQGSGALVNFDGFWGSPHLIVTGSNYEGMPIKVLIDSGNEISSIYKNSVTLKSLNNCILIGGVAVDIPQSKIVDGFPMIVSSNVGKIEIDCILGWDILSRYKYEIIYGKRR